MESAAVSVAEPWHLDDLIRSKRVGGAEWSFIDTGSSGRPIVLLPGSVGTCETFFKQIETLGDEYRIVAVTYPGLTDPALLADGLAAVLQALELEPALIAGSSFAAYWLQFFALRHPQHVTKLLLGNGLVDGSGLLSHPLFEPGLVFGDAHALQSTWREKVAAGPDGQLRRMQLDMLSGRQSAAVLRSRLVSVVQSQPCPPLSIDERRIVLLETADDPIITPAMRMSVRERYPAARVHTLPSGGHYPHVLASAGYEAVLRHCLE